jgi:2-polyprenyl-3-methyl-5-hydroxy-6-metoxy-1,4-benzoquinol methylase
MSSRPITEFHVDPIDLTCQSDSAYRRFRSALKSVGALRSGWYLLLALRDNLGGSSRRSSISFARQFEERENPWHYDSARARQRFAQVVEMLERVSIQRQLGSALEIGCAEGFFTEYLADRCNSLLAVDFTRLALERARRRRSWSESVRFRQWNLRADPLDEKFELIVAMDVLTTIFRPRDLKRAIDKMVECMQPGGYLVLSDPRQCEVFESAWWSRYLIRGGFRILESISKHPALQVIETRETGSHVFGLLQKRPASQTDSGPGVEQAQPGFDELDLAWNPRGRRFRRPLPTAERDKTPIAPRTLP